MELPGSLAKRRANATDIALKDVGLKLPYCPDIYELDARSIHALRGVILSLQCERDLDVHLAKLQP